MYICSAFYLLIAGLFLIAPFGHTATAATYYLDAAVGSSGDGTSWTQAKKTWAEMDTLLDALGDDGAGDTVDVNTGNYGSVNGGVLIKVRTDWLTIQAATSKIPVFTQIVIVGVSSVNGYVKFDGIDITHPAYTPADDGYWHFSDGEAPGYLVDVEDVSYVQFLNGTYTGCSKYLSKGVYLYGADNVIVQHCEISQIVGSGIIDAHGCNNLTVRDNYLHDTCCAGGVRTSQISGTTTGTLIENNHIFLPIPDTTDAYFPHIEASMYYYYLTKTGDFIIGENVVQETTGATGWITSQTTSENLLRIYQTSTHPNGGIAFSTNKNIVGQTSDANAVITTIDDNPTYHPGSGFSIRNSNTSIRKNILHGGAASQSLQFYVDVENMTVENNLFYDSSLVKMDHCFGTCVIRNNTGIGSLSDIRIDRSDYIARYRYNGYPLQVALKSGHDGAGVSIYNNVSVGQFTSPDPSDSGLHFTEDYNISWKPYSDGGNVTKGAHSKIATWDAGWTLHGWYDYFEDIGYEKNTDEYTHVSPPQAFFVDPDYRTDNGYGYYSTANGKTCDYHLAAGSPGINFGDAANQPSDSLGSLDPNGFINDDGPARDADHHSAGCYEYKNSAPVFASIGNKSVNENNLLRFTVNATDADGDPITYSAQNLPLGATFAGQTFSWTPSYVQADTYQVTFIASDPARARDSETITITVNNVNRPPVLAPIGDKSVGEDDMLSFTVSASDADGDAITYSAQNLPSGAAFAGQTFNWTPAYNQSGTYQVTFIASDGQAQDSETITISVENVNRAPVLNSIGNKSVHANDPLSFSVDATDADNDPIQYSAQGLPSGATFASQNFNWTPSPSQAGSYSVTFVASDGRSQDSEAITVTVYTEDKLPPSVTNCSPASDSIQVPLNNLITLHIVDAGKGVDANSVTIKVNSITVYSGNTANYTSATGNCRRTGTKSDYTFVYQPNEMFDFEQEVAVTVDAKDLAGHQMVQPCSYSFWTEMRSFGKNKRVSSGIDNLGNAAPTTVRDSNGNIYAVWHAGPTGSRDIYFAKLAEGAGSFGGSTRLTADPADQCNPAIALGSSDKLYVVWQDNRRGNWDVYVSTSVDGVNWSAERLVTDSNDNQINPAIAIDRSSPNRAHIVWEHYGTDNNYDIYIGTSSDAFATKTVSQITSVVSDQTEPAIAVDSGNTVYVVWTDYRNGSSDIYGAASSGSWTNKAVVSGGSGSNQSSPAIAAETAGSILHLLWVDDTPGNKDVYYAATDGLPSGPLTGSSIIDDSSGRNQVEPAIAVTGSTGNNLEIFACWQDRRNVAGAIGDTDLYFAEVGSDGGTNVFVGDDSTNSNQSQPAIGVDAQGHPYLVWSDSRSPNPQIYYAGSTYLDSEAVDSELVVASAGATVGVNPASIDSVDDVSVTVPAGAYPCDIRITISEIKNPQEFTVPCLAAYDFGPSGIQFNQPVTITIPYAVAESQGSAAPYWYNSLTGALTQQGITDIHDIVVSPTLHALSFKTTHFTPFYLVLGTVGAAAAGGGGGCSVSATGNGSVVEFLLPYMALAAAMMILRLRDAHERKERRLTKSES
jgi:hypothetical protein